MKEKDLTIFRIGTERTSFMEWTVKPTLGTALKTILVAGGITAVALGAKTAVDWMDGMMRPQFIVTYSNTLDPEPPIEWVRPTNWHPSSK